MSLVEGETGAPADVSILLPQGERIPWSGHAASWAVPQILDLIRAHRTTLIFTNTRFLAEYTFQLLWDVNEENLPIGIHHGSFPPRPGIRSRRRWRGAVARAGLHRQPRSGGGLGRH
jgi:ATP-dependent Lhr-like helicase